MKTQFLAIIALSVVTLSAVAQNNTAVKKDTVMRSLPSPLSSPPFPTSDWDGAPLIGIDATAPNYPLTNALGLQKSRLKIYGWLDVGGNVSSSKNSNAPTSYDIIPNGVQLDQVGLKFDLQPNTVQTDHVSYGFLVTTIFGTDYRYTTGLGYFSDQLLKHNNKLWGRPGRNVRDRLFPKSGRW